MSAVRHLEDLAEGQRFESAGRTVTEADVVAFAGVSGDFNQLHTNDLWVREHTPFRGRIAHGMHVLAIASGLPAPGFDQLEILAWLEVQRKMKAPTYPGDTVRAIMTVASVRASASRPTAGVLLLDVEVRNQHDELLQEGRDTLLVARRSDG